MARMTNDEFGERVGCHFSMASRLRNGERLPSRELLRRIISAFELNRADAYDAYDQGPKAFSKYLRDTVLEPAEPEITPETSEPTEEGNG